MFMLHSNNLLRRCCLYPFRKTESNATATLKLTAEFSTSQPHSHWSAHAKLSQSKALHANTVMCEQRAKVKSDTLGCVYGAAIHAVSIYTYFMRLSHPLVSQHGMRWVVFFPPTILCCCIKSPQFLSKCQDVQLLPSNPSSKTLSAFLSRTKTKTDSRVDTCTIPTTLANMQNFPLVNFSQKDLF